VNASTLKDFGYKFNDDLKLVTLDDEPFKFVNQRHYEKLGDLVALAIYDIVQVHICLFELELILYHFRMHLTIYNKQ
jgi:hypothetical protein